MKQCKGCPYRTEKKTKYGEYEWCKKYGCSVSSPKNNCGKDERHEKD